MGKVFFEVAIAMLFPPFAPSSGGQIKNVPEGDAMER
jgi:hypothetical protein